MKLLFICLGGQLQCDVWTGRLNGAPLYSSPGRGGTRAQELPPISDQQAMSPYVLTLTKHLHFTGLQTAVLCFVFTGAACHIFWPDLFCYLLFSH